MDNKQNRKFYWEVKQFYGTSEPNPGAQKPKSNTVVNSVKDILEQNKQYKQTAFNPNINSQNTVSQVMSSMEKASKAGDPNCIGYSKNIHNNGFKIIKEGIFDDIDKKIADYANTTGFNPMATADELSAAIEQEDASQDPSVPLTAQQRALRDMEASVRGRENMAAQQKAQRDQEQEEARKQAGLPTPTNTATGYGTTNNPVSPKPSWAPKSPQTQQTTSNPQATTPATATAPAPTSTQATTPTDPQQQEKDKFGSSRTSVYQKQNTQRRQAAEQQLAALNALDDSKASESMRAARARNKVRLQQEIEGSKDLSGDEIKRRVESDTKTRFMSPEEKAQRRNESRAREIDMYTKGVAQTTDPEAKARLQGVLDKLNKEQQTAGNLPPGTAGTLQQGPPSPTQSGSTPAPAKSPTATGTTPTPKPTATPTSSTAPSTTPTASSMGGALDRYAGSMFSGNKPTTPSTTVGGTQPTGGLNTGSAVNTTARETLGLGKAPTPTTTPTPGVNAARETLGMGTAKPEPEPESAAKKKARETLMR
jgi:chemotaxis protein histidine kinase CheA